VTSIWEEGGSRSITPQVFEEFLRGCGPEYPFIRNGRVLRLANTQDLIDYRHLENSAREEVTYCRQEIRALNLPMKLVTVEHLLGGERIIFYFASESRVDFRELVRRLAWQYRTRIEMRQVGARDEARLVGDLERCGRPCCCQRFLKDLKPVSMRMAKTQKATLDPSKISGRCGRLMCCLRYEDPGYEELRRKLPRKNTFVRTANVVGRVVDSQILTQLVRLALPDNTQVVVANEEILERDLPTPPAVIQPAGPGQPRTEQRQAAFYASSPGPEVPQQAPDLPADEDVPPEDVAEETAPGEIPEAAVSDPQQSRAVPTGEGQSQGRKRRRHRHRRRHPQGDGGVQAGGPVASPQAPANPNPQPPSPQGGPNRDGGHRRRRRRHR
jgi:cell fate regulator YaaT (PSP1 superfamily)